MTNCLAPVEPSLSVDWRSTACSKECEHKSQYDRRRDQNGLTALAAMPDCLIPVESNQRADFGSTACSKERELRIWQEKRSNGLTALAVMSNCLIPVESIQSVVDWSSTACSKQCEHKSQYGRRRDQMDLQNCQQYQIA